MIKRLSDPKHIPKIIAYGKMWHARSAMKDLPFDVKRSEAILRSSLALTPDNATWGAFDKNNKLTGVLIAGIFPYPFFNASYATDLAFIAHAEGDKLFRVFRQWAKSHGAAAIQMGVTSGLPQAEDFYTKLGLERVGGIFYAPC